MNKLTEQLLTQDAGCCIIHESGHKVLVTYDGQVNFLEPVQEIDSLVLMKIAVKALKHKVEIINRNV